MSVSRRRDDLSIQSGAIHAFLSEEAKLGIQVLSIDEGVSITGLLEALGRELHAEIQKAGGEAFGLRPAWIRQARRIDADRRRRDGGKAPNT